MPDHIEWAIRQERTTATVDDHDLAIAYVDAGSGDPVLFLHGVPSWSFIRRDITPAVAENHWVIEDRPEACRRELRSFLGT